MMVDVRRRGWAELRGGVRVVLPEGYELPKQPELNMLPWTKWIMAGLPEGNERRSACFDRLRSNGGQAANVRNVAEMRVAPAGVSAGSMPCIQSRRAAPASMSADRRGRTAIWSAGSPVRT